MYDIMKEASDSGKTFDTYAEIMQFLATVTNLCPGELCFEGSACESNTCEDKLYQVAGQGGIGKCGGSEVNVLAIILCAVGVVAGAGIVGVICMMQRKKQNSSHGHALMGI